MNGMNLQNGVNVQNGVNGMNVMNVGEFSFEVTSGSVYLNQNGDDVYLSMDRLPKELQAKCISYADKLHRLLKMLKNVEEAELA
jgi:virulence-associated protein VapD